MVRIKVALEASYSVEVSELYYSKSYDKLKSLVRKITRWTNLACLPLIIVFALLAEYILGIFGSEYRVWTMSFYVLLASVSINVLTGSTSLYMNMNGKQKVLRNILILTAVLNIVLNLLLIPNYKMMGAATASPISVAMWNFMTVAYVYYKDRILLLLH